MRSKRFEALAKRPVNQDGFVKEWIEEGFIAMESPNDPKPSIRIVNGAVTELDGKPVEQFDLIDHFIARYGINLARAEEVMAMDSVKLANMLCDPNVKRSDIVPLTTAMTPAKIVEVVSHMNVVEMMMAMQKMRARRTPSQQAHVTNIKDNPVQIAADAAEGAWRGFDEQETTVAVARYAPFNAIALLVGSQVGRPGVLTQCSLEEATELKLGMLGHTCYAETISVYGTEPVFTDGDDTPWSKGFLASSYASRGLKMRFTSGSGSEVQMGYAEGKSMLYLEARCIYITKAAGVARLTRLMDECGLLCHLGIIDQGNAYYILKIESPATISVRSHEGKSLSLYRSGIGKCLLAWQPASVQASIIEDLQWERATPTTITDAQQLREELGRIRARGWSFDNGEDYPDVRCVAAPVFNANNDLTAAISVVGTRLQINEDNRDYLAGKAIACAKDISRLLGWKSPFEQLASS